MTENEEIKKQKKSKLLTMLITFGIFSLIAYIILFVGLFQSGAKGHVATSNSTARAHYKMMTNGVIDIGSQLYIPQEGEYTIYGESEDFSYYIVYPDEYIEKKTLIYGEPDNPVNNYWAVRFNSGKVTEVWTAKFPLSEEDLLPYTRDEQLERVKYRGGICSEEVVGFYNVLNDSSID